MAHLRFAERAAELAGLPPEPLFTEIWKSNLWGSATSRSGLGSEATATARLRSGLPALLERIGVRTLLDLPCGDFAWMDRLDLKLDRYIGADIVGEIVERNAALFATTDGRVKFRKLNLLSDALPAADAILCRDCFVHLSFANIGKALANIRGGNLRWLIATTFTEHRENRDAMDGDWRLLNLEAAPFGFPPADAILNEECTEAGGAYADKSLGVWRVADLPIFP
jgi:hypothetical protein